jgi:hypothetical protein
MSNQLGTLNSALILQEALRLVFTQRPLLSAITKNMDTMGALQNQTVITRLKTVPPAVNADDAAPDFITTDVPVVLNKSRKVHARFTAAQLNSTNRNLLQEAAEPLARSMANDIIDSVAALWTTANFTNETVSNAPDYSTMLELRKAITSRGVHGTRYMAVNPATYEALLLDPRANRFYKSFLPPGTDPIENGELNQVAGFAQIFEYPAIPSDNHMTGFAFTDEATVLAIRPPLDPREAFPNGQVPFPGTFEIVTDPVTGLSVAAVEYIEADTLACNVQMRYIYGVAKGNTDAGQRLVYQAN